MAIAITTFKHAATCEACGRNRRVVSTITFNTAKCVNLCLECQQLLYNSLGSTEPHSGKWFKTWEETKKDILAAMHKNLAADLDAGYSYTGQSIQKQLAAIDEYKHEFDEQLMSFVGKSNKEVEDWCYYDLKSRGWIE